jgi:hypothetical protein
MVHYLDRKYMPLLPEYQGEVTMIKKYVELNQRELSILESILCFLDCF